MLVIRHRWFGTALLVLSWLCLGPASLGSARAADAVQRVLIADAVELAVPEGVREGPMPATARAIHGKLEHALTDGAEPPLTIWVESVPNQYPGPLPVASDATLRELARGFVAGSPAAFGVELGAYDPARGAMNFRFQTRGVSRVSQLLEQPPSSAFWSKEVPLHGVDPALVRCLYTQLLAGASAVTAQELLAHYTTTSSRCGLAQQDLERFVAATSPAAFAPAVTTFFCNVFETRSTTVFAVTSSGVERNLEAAAASALIWKETTLRPGVALAVETPRSKAFEVGRHVGVVMGSLLGGALFWAGLSWLLVRAGLSSKVALTTVALLLLAVAAFALAHADLDALLQLAAYVVVMAAAYRPLHRRLRGMGNRSTLIRSLRRDQRGLSSVEYVVVLVLIASVAIAAWQVFGERVRAALGKADTTLNRLSIDDSEPGSGASSAAARAERGAPSTRSDPGSTRGPAESVTPALAGDRVVGPGAADARGLESARTAILEPTLDDAPETPQSTLSQIYRSDAVQSVLGGAVGAEQALIPGLILLKSPNEQTPAFERARGTALKVIGEAQVLAGADIASGGSTAVAFGLATAIPTEGGGLVLAGAGVAGVAVGTGVAAWGVVNVKAGLDTLHNVQMTPYTPERTLPTDAKGVPMPDSPEPHTQLGRSKPKFGSEPQAREWDYGSNGKLQPKRDIDFSDHGTPDIHPNPHEHELTPNNPKLAPKGGYQRGPAKPLE